MKKLSVYVFLIMMLAQIQVHAINTGTRGGGDAVVCKTGGEIQSVELLDYFEAEQMGLVLDLGQENLAYEEKVKLVIKRWSKFDPMMTDAFRDELVNFNKNAAFLDRSYIIDIDDSAEIISPSNCHLRQIAVSRLDDLAPGEKKYLVDKKLWSKLSESGKAGLVFHEIFWSHYKKKNDELTDSSYIRRFNSVISSAYFSQYTPFQYIQLIESLWSVIDPLSYFYSQTGYDSPSILYKNRIYSITLLGLRIEDGVVRSGFMPRPTLFHIGENDFYFSGYSLFTSNEIIFYQNEAVKEGRLFKPIDIKLPGEVRLILPALFGKLTFSEDGTITNVDVKYEIDGIRYNIFEGNPDLLIRATLIWKNVSFPISSAKFYENGQLQFLEIPRKADGFIFSWNGKRYRVKTNVSYSSDAEIEFDQNGAIVKTYQIEEYK